MSKLKTKQIAESTSMQKPGAGYCVCALGQQFEPFYLMYTCSGQEQMLEMSTKCSRKGRSTAIDHERSTHSLAVSVGTR